MQQRARFEAGQGSEAAVRACPCCGGRGFEPLIDFGEVPVSGHYRVDPEYRPQSARLAFEVCAECGLVRQADLAAPRDYSGTTRPTARQFPAYGTELIARLTSLGVRADDLVLDIGSNDGSFLEALRAGGFARLAGVEPSAQLAEQARKRGFTVESDYFGPELVARLLERYGPARAVICRHTLEHVPDPFAFVAALHRCMGPDAVALVEVPDGSAIPELMNVYEFWDEHLYCFCAENLGRLIGRAGMSVFETQVHSHLETRNLLVWCGTGAMAAQEASALSDRDCAALWRLLVPEWEGFRARFGAAVRGTPMPVYMIGGSHSQYNLASYAGIGGLVHYMIDDDPEKVGRIPPISEGSPSIISTPSSRIPPAGARC